MPTIFRHANYTISPASRWPVWAWEDMDQLVAVATVDSMFTLLTGRWVPSRFYPDVGNPIGGQTIFSGLSWGKDVRWQGGRTMWAITGVTRDVYGTPLASCDVKLFRALNDSLQYRVTSDANGAYTVLTPFTDGHYVVAYLSGTPDVEGTTIRTLVGV